MRDAPARAGHPVVFSLYEWGTSKPWLWARSVGHLWRSAGDIYNCWDCVKDNGGSKSFGVLRNVDVQDGLRQYAGPGPWNDPDHDRGRQRGPHAQRGPGALAMWCMLAAPLIAGNDLRRLNPQTLAVLTNKDVIAVDQDPLRVQGFKLSTQDSVDT